MAIKICPICQLPFSQQFQEEICPNCNAEGESQFQRIKAYLYEHPGASATELVKQLGVTIRQIQHYLREDRLEVVGDGFTGLRCETCGKAIKTGRLCEDCVKNGVARKNEEKKEAALKELKEMKTVYAADKQAKEEKKKASGLRFRDDSGSRRSGR